MAAPTIGAHGATPFGESSDDTTTPEFTSQSVFNAAVWVITDSDSTPTVSDNKGNTFVNRGRADLTADGTADSATLFTCIGGTGGASHQITASALFGLSTVFFVEVPGSDIAIDGTPMVASDGASPYTLGDLITTVKSSALLVGFTSFGAGNGVSVPTWGNGFSVLDTYGNNDEAWTGSSATRTVAALGSYSLSMTVTNANVGLHGMALLAFYRTSDPNAFTASLTSGCSNATSLKKAPARIRAATSIASRSIIKKAAPFKSAVQTCTGIVAKKKSSIAAAISSNTSTANRASKFIRASSAFATGYLLKSVRLVKSTVNSAVAAITKFVSKRASSLATSGAFLSRSMSLLLVLVASASSAASIIKAVTRKHFVAIFGVATIARLMARQLMAVHGSISALAKVIAKKMTGVAGAASGVVKRSTLAKPVASLSAVGSIVKAVRTSKSLVSNTIIVTFKKAAITLIASSSNVASIVRLKAVLLMLVASASSVASSMKAAYRATKAVATAIVSMAKVCAVSLRASANSVLMIVKNVRTTARAIGVAVQMFNKLSSVSFYAVASTVTTASKRVSVLAQASIGVVVTIVRQVSSALTRIRNLFVGGKVVPVVLTVEPCTISTNGMVSVTPCVVAATEVTSAVTVSSVEVGDHL